VQIHYMSFPGTIGYDAVDGVIADAEVVPPGAEADFHERVWRLPRCYYVNDNRRGLAAASSRRDNGLPEDALVLACLNQSYKLRRPFFAAWMEALRSQPDAVLWLLAVPRREPICAPKPRKRRRSGTPYLRARGAGRACRTGSVCRSGARHAAYVHAHDRRRRAVGGACRC
jgi:predicted O-linked N-acetylglucosamine transferase (SPINDLY family)